MLTSLFFFFFFNDTATTEIYTLFLHDALPISSAGEARGPAQNRGPGQSGPARPRYVQGELLSLSRSGWRERDRKSTRLNSSHSQISYAVFCLKKKKHKHADVNISDTNAVQYIE